MADDQKEVPRIVGEWTQEHTDRYMAVAARIATRVATEAAQKRDEEPARTG